MDWRAVLGTALETFPARPATPPPATAPPAPLPLPDISVELEPLRKALQGMRSPLANRLGRGEAPGLPPHVRPHGEPSRYEAWLQATSSLSMAADDDIPSEAIEEEILRPAWLKEVEANPDDHTAWETVQDLLASARASAPQRKAEREAAERARADVVLTAWRLARGVGAAPPPDAPARPPRAAREAHLDVLDEAFALYRAPDGIERIYSVSPTREAVLMMTESHLEQQVYNFLKRTAEQTDGDPPTMGAVKQAIAIWKKETAPLTVEPEPFAFEDGPILHATPLVYKRFDWKPVAGQHPAWDEYLVRLTDPGAFKAWIWSLFEPSNRGRQYMWIHGDGQDGKSVVMRVLAGVFGLAAVAIGNSHLSDTRFLFSALWGKRLVIYADCKNSKFGMTEVVRNVTSGDPVLIEFKGQTPFSGTLNTKLMVGSNDAPEITSGTADISRCVYLKVIESLNKDDPTWEPRLREELPFFLNDCRAAYIELCPNGGQIKLSEASHALRLAAAREFESDYEDIFAQHFEVDPEKAVDGIAMKQALNAADLKDTRRIRDFKKWLERIKGVVVHRGASGVAYRGIKEKDRRPFGGAT